MGWPGSAGAVGSRFRLCCGCGHVTLGVGSHVAQDFARSSAHKALVAGDTALYCSLTTLARALAQYLLAASKLPGHLYLPPEREGDTVKFVVMVLEALAWRLVHERIPMSLDLQAGLDCCCLALQLPRLWNVASSPEMVTHTCSLIHCVRCLLEASESPHLASALRFN